jgi:hypothetical protein
MEKEIKIEKEKVIKVKPRIVKTFMGESMNDKPEYLKDMPNQRLHKIVSFIKSGLRGAACLLGAFTSVEMGFIVLGIAEIVGVIEEMV